MPDFVLLAVGSAEVLAYGGAIFAGRERDDVIADGLIGPHDGRPFEQSCLGR
jgi:hypothetical protein